MILAAGLGVRMRPLTDDRPKALVEVAGKPLIAHLLESLDEAGAQKIVVNMHYRPGPLAAYLAAHPLKQRIVLSDESDKILDTGGGVKKALSELGDKPFFAANCDSFFPDGDANPFLALSDRWKESMGALLLLKETEEAVGYGGQGDFFMDASGRLKRGSGKAPFAYAGLQILDPALFGEETEAVFSLNRVYDKALNAGKLFGVPYPGRWFHIGTPGALDEAERLARHD